MHPFFCTTRSGTFLCRQFYAIYFSFLSFNSKYLLIPYTTFFFEMLNMSSKLTAFPKTLLYCKIILNHPRQTGLTSQFKCPTTKKMNMLRIFLILGHASTFFFFFLITIILVLIFIELLCLYLFMSQS